MKVGQIIIDKDGKKYRITDITNFMYSEAEKRLEVVLKEVKS